MSDPVNKPDHYQGGIECIDYLEQVLGPEGFVAYCRGNVVKYNHRAEYKGKFVEDLQKAAWYAARAADAAKRYELVGITEDEDDYIGPSTCGDCDGDLFVYRNTCTCPAYECTDEEWLIEQFDSPGIML